MPATASPILGNSSSIGHMEGKTVAQIRSTATAKTNLFVNGAAPMTAMNSLRRLAEEAHLKEEQGDQRAALYKFVQVGVLLEFVEESDEYQQELQRERRGALYQMMQEFNKGPLEAMVKSVINLQRALRQEEQTEVALDGGSEYDSGSLSRRSGATMTAAPPQPPVRPLPNRQESLRQDQDQKSQERVVSPDGISLSRPLPSTNVQLSQVPATKSSNSILSSRPPLTPAITTAFLPQPAVRPLPNRQESLRQDPDKKSQESVVSQDGTPPSRPLLPKCPQGLGTKPSNSPPLIPATTTTNATINTNFNIKTSKASTTPPATSMFATGHQSSIMTIPFTPTITVGLGAKYNNNSGPNANLEHAYNHNRNEHNIHSGNNINSGRHDVDLGENNSHENKDNGQYFDPFQSPAELQFPSRTKVNPQNFDPFQSPAELQFPPRAQPQRRSTDVSMRSVGSNRSGPNDERPPSRNSISAPANYDQAVGRTTQMGKMEEMETERPKITYFYDKDAPYYSFTNFSPDPVPANDCNQCNAKPKFFDGTQLHPYCSGTCAKDAEKVRPKIQAQFSQSGLSNLSEVQILARPYSISELAQIAKDESPPNSRSFKDWLRTADTLGKQGNQAKEEGDIQAAFLFLSRSATYIFEKIPHSTGYDDLNPAQKTNLKNNGHDILVSVEQLKSHLAERYRQWLASDPNHAKHPSDLQRLHGAAVHPSSHSDWQSDLDHSSNKLGKKQDRRMSGQAPNGLPNGKLNGPRAPHGNGEEYYHIPGAFQGPSDDITQPPQAKPKAIVIENYQSPLQTNVFKFIAASHLPTSAPLALARSNSHPNSHSHWQSDSGHSSDKGGYGNDYPQGSPRTNGFLSTEPKQHPQVDLPITSAITPHRLYSLLETRGLNILLLDVRSRDEFERERINHDAIVCVEPLVLSRQGINSRMIEGAQVIYPSTEQVFFKNRSRFDLIIMYDQKSTTLGSANSSISTLFRVIFESEFRHPMLLIGGLKAWKEAIGKDGVLKLLSPTSSTPSSSLPTNGHVIPPNAIGSSASTASKEETFLYDMPTVKAKYPPADQIQATMTAAPLQPAVRPLPNQQESLRQDRDKKSQERVVNPDGIPLSRPLPPTNVQVSQVPAIKPSNSPLPSRPPLTPAITTAVLPQPTVRPLPNCQESLKQDQDKKSQERMVSSDGIPLSRSLQRPQGPGAKSSNSSNPPPSRPTLTPTATTTNTTINATSNIKTNQTTTTPPATSFFATGHHPSMMTIPLIPTAPVNLGAKYNNNGGPNLGHAHNHNRNQHITHSGNGVNSGQHDVGDQELRENNPANDCNQCNAKPKFFDGTKLHPYCSRTCAKDAEEVRLKIQARFGQSGSSNQSEVQILPARSSKPTQVVQAAQAVQALCLWCSAKPQFETQIPKYDRSLFCGKNCISLAEKSAPTILLIPSDHPLFQSVSNQFKTSWRHSSNRPTIKYIYKILCAPYYTKQYMAYRRRVEIRIQQSYTTGGPGNEQRRWHGTKRDCKIGDEGSTRLCSSSRCSLCRIIETSFDLNYYKNNTSWGRFGCGIYTSSTSSKANDYSVNLIRSPTKALLLNKVVVGKGEKLTDDSPNLTAPPTAGYDSVLGEPGGGSLNYDECVVYNNDAIIPAYLVIYS